MYGTIIITLGIVGLILVVLLVVILNPSAEQDREPQSFGGTCATCGGKVTEWEYAQYGFLQLKRCKVCKHLV